MKRDGAGEGSGWMRRFSDWASAPAADADSRRRVIIILMSIWAAVILGMILTSSFDHVVRRALVVSGNGRYESAAHLGGMPLVAIGRNARGVVAIGDLPIGLLAIGSLPIGLVAIGGVGLGVIAINAISVGLLVSVGGFALGTIAIGGGAVGHWALGGLAVGNYAYAGGGVALGRYEAVGRQRERLIGG